MSPRFPLRTTKLYADLVAGDGTACVAYLLRFELPGVRRVTGGVELYRPGEPPCVVRAVRAEDPDAARGEDDCLTVAMELPEGPFVLRYESPSRAALPPGAPPAPGLRWSVETARAVGTATWEGAERRTLRGEGYADRVEVEGLPRSAGLEELVWGRAHGPGGTVVFTGIRSATGGDWRRAALWAEGVSARERPVWRDAFRLGAEAGGWEAGVGGHDAPPLRAGGGRILHDGPAVDRARAPGRLEGALLRAAVGPGRQLRRLDPLLRASVEPGSEARPGGWLLHERVRFMPLRRWRPSGLRGSVDPGMGVSSGHRESSPT